MENVPLKVLTDWREKQSPPINQSKAARLVGVSRASWSRWEAGHRKPGREKIPQVSERTGIHPKELRPDLAEMIEGAA